MLLLEAEARGVAADGLQEPDCARLITAAFEQGAARMGPCESAASTRRAEVRSRFRWSDQSGTDACTDDQRRGGCSAKTPCPTDVIVT